MTVKQISAVIAALDEAGNVEELHARLQRALGSFPGAASELIWVVEGSDDTASILRDLASRGAPAASTIIEPPVRRGLGAAFRAGFDAVSPGADIVVTMDADLNHQPEELPRLVDALAAENADIVVGSRLVRGASGGQARWRRWLSAAANRLMLKLAGVDVRDMSSGYRIYRAASLRAIRFENDGFAFLPEILMKAAAAGMRVVEVPITFTPRTRGKSKLHLGEASRSYLRLLNAQLSPLRTRKTE